MSHSRSRGGGGRRVAEPSRRPRSRSHGAGLLRALYRVAVILSAFVVAGYIGWSLWVKPPEQAQVPQSPAQTPVTPASSAGNTSAAAQPQGFTRRDGVYNIFLAATDAGGTRTDTMMVACYDIPNQKVGIVSIPRDTITDRASGKSPKLVYGPGGVKERAADVSEMLGIPIDYYIKVDLDGFVALVDYLGGVDFYVPCDMNYDDPTPGQDLHIHYKEGQQHLNGQQVMEVARFRKNNPDENGHSTGYSDVGRTQTQQKLLMALAKKLLSWGSLTKINGFVEIFEQNVETDLALNEMLYFASQAIGVDLSSAVETATLEGRGDGVYHKATWCFELDRDKTLETVNALINPYNEALTLEDMRIMKAERYMS